MPLAFEENDGLFDRRVRFFARGENYGMFLAAAGPVLVTRTPSIPNKTNDDVDAHNRFEFAVLKMNFDRASRHSQISGLEEAEGATSYFIGDRSHWRSGSRRFARVRYDNLYRGIDLTFYGNRNQLEYDLVIHPQANPKVIKFNFGRGPEPSIDSAGDLKLATGSGELTLRQPIAYQIVDGQRQEIGCRFIINRHHQVMFDLEKYDASKELTIDPVLVYATYLGGSGFSSSDEEIANDVAVDAQGNAYIVGSTVSIDFPVLNAYKPTGGGFSDAFVVKINPAGNALVYSTYLGGNRTDQGLAIAVDADGSAYVTGVSNSADFPTTPGAFQTTGQDSDVFVVKLSPAGNTLVYSTLLSGDRITLPNGGGTLSSAETGFGIAVDSQAQAVVVGQTQSANFPHSHEIQSSPAGGFDAFVTKLNAAGSGLVFSTYLGGSTTDEADAVTIDKADNILVCGRTYSNDFRITPGAFQTSHAFNTVPIAFVTKFSPTGGLMYSTYLGDSFEQARSIAVDVAGNAFVSGETQSSNFPVTPTAIKSRPKRGDFFSSADGAASWQSSAPLNGDVTVNAVALASDGKLYIGTSAGLFSSVDGGKNWTLAGLSGTNILCVAISPANPSIIFAGANSQGIFKSSDGGSSWTNPFPSSTVFTITFHPTDPSKIYAGRSATSSGVQSSDGGDNWVQFGAGGAVRGIAFAPGDPNTIYLAASTGVMKTTDAGANWTNVLSGSSFFSAVVIDPAAPATVYAGHSTFGLSKTTNGGQNWTTIGGLASNQVNSLVIDSSTTPATLYAGLGSGGLFKSVNGAASWQATGLAYSTVNAVLAKNQTVYAGATLDNRTDAFLSKLSPDGSTLLYSTYLGGGGFDTGYGIALDQSGNPVISGYGGSIDFPQVNALQVRKGATTDAFVMKLDMATNTISFSSFVGGSGSENGRAVAVDPAGGIYLVGNTHSTDFPATNAFQSSLNNIYDAFVTKISTASGPSSVRFRSASASVSEADGQAIIIVDRSGDLSLPATVDYQTADSAGAGSCSTISGNASSRCDYSYTAGTLQFAANQSSLNIPVNITDDGYTENPETFTISLSNPSGTLLATPFTESITIVDNDGAQRNPIDQAGFFVGQHYVDFLSRQPDQSGLDFWTGQINSCGNDAACTEVKRINVSAAFFLSIEFQQTGYLVERFYKSAYGDGIGTSTLGVGAHQLVVPSVRFNEFVKDTQRIGKGVVVLAPGWEQALENNKQAYALEFVQTSRFITAFPTSMTPPQFVDKLNQNAGMVLSPSERTTAINLFGAAADTTKVNARAQALRQIAEDQDLYNAEFNRAFVLAEYIGYLRRNPNDAPEPTLDYTGYDFWLTKLNQFNGDYINAEMVKAFISSNEYRQRFGP